MIKSNDEIDDILLGKEIFYQDGVRHAGVEFTFLYADGTKEIRSYTFGSFRNSLGRASATTIKSTDKDFSQSS